jgi:hypothetical protein
VRADPRLPRKTTPCPDPKPSKTFAWWTSAGCGAGITLTRHRSDRPGGSGLTYISGLPDKPPAGWGWSYMDDTGGMYGAMCALMASTIAT